MTEEGRCPVCQTLFSAVWICTMRNCPEKIQKHTTDIRKKYRDAVSGFGEPEIKDDERS